MLKIKERGSAMRVLELKTVEQMPEVLKVKSAISEMQKSINSVENDSRELDKLVSETSTNHQNALSDFGLGKINKDEFAKIELAMKEAQNKKHKFVEANNSVVIANKKQALKNLEVELKAAEDLAADEIVKEIDKQIEEIRTEIQSPILEIKKSIKELEILLKHKRLHSPNSTLTSRYNFPFDNLVRVWNYLRTLEFIGTDKIDSDFIQYIDSSRFLN